MNGKTVPGLPVHSHKEGKQMRKLLLAATAVAALFASACMANAANPAGWYLGIGAKSVSATEKNLSSYTDTSGTSDYADTVSASGMGYDIDLTAVTNLFPTSFGTLTGLVSVNAGMNNASTTKTDSYGYSMKTSLGWSGSALAGLGFYMPITDDIGIMPYAQGGFGFATGKSNETYSGSNDFAWSNTYDFVNTAGRAGVIATYGNWFANANYFFANGSNNRSNGHGSGYKDSSSQGLVMNGFAFIAGYHWQL